MKIGQKKVRVNITLKLKDYELLACLSRESVYFKITSLATRYVIERIYKEAQSSSMCRDFLRGGKQIDLFKPIAEAGDKIGEKTISGNNKSRIEKGKRKIRRD